jgi:hypothetical protein
MYHLLLLPGVVPRESNHLEIVAVQNEEQDGPDLVPTVRIACLIVPTERSDHDPVLG